MGNVLVVDVFVSVDGWAGSDGLPGYFGYLGPELADWILEEGYGRVLSRPVLSIRERELIVVAVLAALRLPLQLESHVRGALRVGATAAEVAAMRKAGARR